MKKNIFKINYGFTLVELMFVVAIFSVLFIAMMSIMTNSDTYWKKGQNKMVEQQEARRIIDNVEFMIRESNPSWTVNSTNYTLSISSNHTRLDFYKPEFDSGDNVTGLSKITFKLNDSNAKELLKKVGTQTAVTVSDKVESITFGAGCSGCTLFNCTSIATDCPIIKIDVQTKQSAYFNLTSKVMLRNQNYTLENDTEVLQPGEGEF